MLCPYGKREIQAFYGWDVVLRTDFRHAGMARIELADTAPAKPGDLVIIIWTHPRVRPGGHMGPPLQRREKPAALEISQRNYQKLDYFGNGMPFHNVRY